MKFFPTTVQEFAQHFSKPYRIHFTIMLLVVIFLSVATAVQPYILKKLIDAATPVLGSSALIHAALWPTVALLTLIVLINLVWRINNYANLKVLPSLKADIIDAAADYIHHHSFKFFQDNLGGAVSNRITDLANNTENLIFTFFGNGLIMQAMIIVSVILMAAVVNPMFSAMFLLWTILFVYAAFYFSRGVEPFAKKFADSRSTAVGSIVDSFSNAISIILFSREDYERKYLRASLDLMVDKDQALQKKLMGYAMIMGSMTILVQAVTILMLLYFGLKGLLTVGDFVLIFMLSMSVIEQVWAFAQTMFKVSEQLGIFKQALSFIATEIDIVDTKGAVPLQVKTGVIIFSKVEFFYSDLQKLFHDETIIIQGGEKVGLVGFSGSGKSTFVNLITRTFDIQKGMISIDDQSINSVTLQSLRNNIAFIPQDPTLFHRSLMENIRFGRLDATDEEVFAAAKQAHAHEFALELSNGYQTLVGERGVKLSGGQRQRIAIARAILKDAPILILDEATSALDSVTEQLIQDSLHFVMQNKTVIVIAHRLSTIKAMSRILVFQQGRIVEDGTHDRLLEQGEVYKNLWHMQQGITY